jgi:hypothetical protein
VIFCYAARIQNFDILFCCVQDVVDHMQVAVQGQGETQVVHIFGDGVLFPMIQAYIRTAGFTRSDEANRYIL